MGKGVWGGWERDARLGLRGIAFGGKTFERGVSKREWPLLGGLSVEISVVTNVSLLWSGIRWCQCWRERKMRIYSSTMNLEIVSILL